LWKQIKHTVFISCLQWEVLKEKRELTSFYVMTSCTREWAHAQIQTHATARAP